MMNRAHLSPQRRLQNQNLTFTTDVTKMTANILIPIVTNDVYLMFVGLLGGLVVLSFIASVSWWYTTLVQSYQPVDAIRRSKMLPGDLA